MKFQVLSHAGLMVTADNKTLICDPWLVGSTYWRSWWNYPPVEDDLLNSLKPDFIYITHVHWDHFAAPSLKRFDKNTPVIIPREPCGRMLRDLHDIGFMNVIELSHGESMDLSSNFTITSYHFHVFTDSGLIIEADDKVIFNANDAKFMGWPLQQILKNHPRIDFVLRSHSSANSRICYEVVGGDQFKVDDRDEYIASFASFAKACKAEYAIPFASNHCHLHRDTVPMNSYVVTPVEVQEHFRNNNIGNCTLQVMISGDSWDSDAGFLLSGVDWFSDRDERIQAYGEMVGPKLEETYLKESMARFNQARIIDYFARFHGALPWLVKVFFRSTPILYVLNAGVNQYFVVFHPYTGQVDFPEGLADQEYSFQIHTPLALFNSCIALDLFSHLAISKRVKYRVAQKSYKLARLHSLIINFYEYEYFPISKIRWARFLSCWARRWREVILYGRILMDRLIGKPFSYRRYLPESRVL